MRHPLTSRASRMGQGKSLRVVMFLEGEVARDGKSPGLTALGRTLLVWAALLLFPVVKFVEHAN
jgi:hypothetical protein